MKKIVILCTVILIALLPAAAGCGKAEFEVNALNVTPSEVASGEAAKVSANVENIGGADGVYIATLTIDAVEIETKEIALAPGAKETITFTVTEETPGAYQVGIGELTGSLWVLKPAEFKLTSPCVPSEILTGETVTITADVTNIGEVEGTYTMVLAIGEQEFEERDVSVGAGATETVFFEVTSPEASGDYKLSVGEAIKTLTVVDWTDCTLRHDNEKVDDYWTLFEERGCLSRFPLLYVPFKIQKISIYGQVSGNNLKDWKERSFTLRIWDEERTQELWSKDCLYDLFKTSTPSWGEVEVPGIRVDNDFYVEVITNGERLRPDSTKTECGLFVGLDLSTTEAESEVTLNGVIQPWLDKFGPKEKAAWMIRVEGAGGFRFKQYVLKYDDGVAEDSLSSCGGYLIDFSPSATPFTIKKVRMLGGLYGTGWEGKDFEVEIWGKDREVLYSATYPVNEFFTEANDWVEVEIPDVEVTDQFYVHVFTGTCRMEGIHIGADNSVVNEHSNLTRRTAEGTVTIAADWPYSPDFWFADKSKVNWIIQVVGISKES
jgi:hypothetical protein